MDERKVQLLNKISLAGLISTFEKRPEWVEAFEYYWSKTGDYNLKPGCSKCYINILEWLRK